MNKKSISRVDEIRKDLLKVIIIRLNIFKIMSEKKVKIEAVIIS